MSTVSELTFSFGSSEDAEIEITREKSLSDYGNEKVFIVKQGENVKLRIEEIFYSLGLEIFSDMNGISAPYCFESIEFKKSGSYYSARLTAKRPGKNTIYAKYKNQDTSHIFKLIINVSSNFGFSCNLGLNYLIMQTHLFQCMGKFQDWEKKYELAYKAGYNCIHITPINQLSKFGSAYSISSALDLDDRIFSPTIEWSNVGEFVKKMEKKYGILTVSDLVPNHCSTESNQLRKTPDICVNLENHKHLRIPFRIELALIRATISLEGLDVFQNDSFDIIKRSLYDYIARAKIEEFFLYDEVLNVKIFEQEFEKLKDNEFKTHTDQKNVDFKDIYHKENNYLRFGKTIDVANCLHYFKTVSSFRDWIRDENKKILLKIKNDIDSAINNSMAQFKWLYLEESGPKLGRTLSFPTRKVVRSCFYSDYLNEILLLKDEKNCSELDKFFEKHGNMVWANNGWVMNSNDDFASANSDVYLRRELNVWSDLVKYNFDSPDLLDYLLKYTKLMSETFHGIRLDNSHTTPYKKLGIINEKIREVNPRSIIFAELFAVGADHDNKIFSECGLDSIVREMFRCQNSQSIANILNSTVDQSQQIGNFFNTFNRHKYRVILPQILYDQTHDNYAISQHLICAFIASQSMSIGPIGSTRGVDEFLGKKLAINESLEYLNYDAMNKYQLSMIEFRRHMNLLHLKMEKEGYSELYSQKVQNYEILYHTRHNPSRQERIISLISLEKELNKESDIEIEIEGCKEIELLYVISAETVKISKLENKNYLQPESESMLNIVIQSNSKKISDNYTDSIFKYNGKGKLRLKRFVSGSIIIFKVYPVDKSISALEYINSVLDPEKNPSEIQLKKYLEDLSNYDLTKILYSTNDEEMEDINFGLYNLPNSYDQMKFCGIMGQILLFAKIARFGDMDGLGHSLCDNIRNGDWLADYITERLSRRRELKYLGEFISSIILKYKDLISYMKPGYLARILVWLLQKISMIINKRSGIEENSLCSLKSVLALSSLQFLNKLNRQKFKVFENGKESECTMVTLAAGMPHFASGLFRSWGRDTFISIKGLLLDFRRFSEAKDIIILFARSIKVGSVPNLLGDAYKHAVYNARDSTWWWMNSICDYCAMTSDEAILSYDIYPNYTPNKKFCIGELMHKCLLEHFRGKVNPTNIFVDKNTGFIHGGSKKDAGTWMDKCDDSDSRVPSTPRDGASIEIQALAYKIIKWMQTTAFFTKRSDLNLFKSRDGRFEIDLNEWEHMIMANFDDKYFINYGKDKFYRDTLGSSITFDNKLRPNQSLALAISPELFNVDNASLALEVIEKYLFSPNSTSQIGIKTLDSRDPDYRPEYNLSTNSSDHKLNRGFSYHNGPEWIWIGLYYLIAELNFRSEKYQFRIKANEIPKFTTTLLYNPYLSLPELTNANGGYCQYSCESQAWSLAGFIELIKYLTK